MKQPLHERLVPIFTFGAGSMAAGFGEKWRNHVVTVGAIIVILSGLLMFFSWALGKRPENPAHK